MKTGGWNDALAKKELWWSSADVRIGDHAPLHVTQRLPQRGKEKAVYCKFFGTKNGEFVICVICFCCLMEMRVLLRVLVPRLVHFSFIKK